MSRPLEGHGGQVAVERFSRGTVERWVCVLFAGYAAEVRFAPVHATSRARVPRSDDEQAEDYLERAGMANDSTHGTSCALAPRELVEQHWSLSRASLVPFEARGIRCS